MVGLTSISDEVVERICSYLDTKDQQVLAFIVEHMHREETENPARRPTRLSTCTDMMIHPRLNNRSKRIIYKKYLEEETAARRTDHFITELLCLRMPVDVLEHHMLRAFIRSFNKREIHIEEKCQIIVLEDTCSGRTFTDSLKTCGAADDISPLLYSTLEEHVLAKLIKAAPTSSILQHALAAKNMSVEKCLVAAVGKAMINNCKVAIPYSQPAAIPPALMDYNNIIENLDLHLDIKHDGKAAYRYPKAVFELPGNVSAIQALFPSLMTLPITVTEMQKQTPVRYIHEKPTMQTYAQMYVPGALPASHLITFKELLHRLAMELKGVEGLAETSVMGISDMGKSVDFVYDKTQFPKITMWVDGEEQI